MDRTPDSSPATGTPAAPTPIPTLHPNETFQNESRGDGRRSHLWRGRFLSSSSFSKFSSFVFPRLPLHRGLPDLPYFLLPFLFFLLSFPPSFRCRRRPLKVETMKLRSCCDTPWMIITGEKSRFDQLSMLKYLTEETLRDNLRDSMATPGPPLWLGTPSSSSHPRVGGTRSDPPDGPHPFRRKGP